MKRRLKAPSPALVISMLALFVALGGTSLAAANFINGSRIKNHTIAETKLTKKTIKALHGAKGATGAAGSQGVQGAQGVQGVQGQIGPSNAYYDSVNGTEATLSLPAGNYVVWGVGSFDNPNASGQDQANCTLVVNGAGTVTTTFPGATVPNNNGEANVSDQGIAHLPSSSQILNGCTATSSGTTTVTTLTAIKVDTATP